MPINPVSPAATAPADRLALTAASVRGVSPAIPGNGYSSCAFVDEATPSYGAGQCSYNCAVFDE